MTAPDLFYAPPGTDPGGPDYPAGEEMALQLAGLWIVAAAEGRDITFGPRWDELTRVLFGHLAGVAGDLVYLARATDLSVAEIVQASALLRSIETPEPDLPSKETAMPLRRRKPQTLADARAAIAELEAKVGEWETRHGVTEVELSSLESRIGEDVLEAADSEAVMATATADMARLRSELDISSRAARSAWEALHVARRDALAAAAVEVRRRAGRLRSEAIERATRTERLLDELEKHEGIRYVTDRFRPRTEIVNCQANDWDTVAAELEQLAAMSTVDIAAWTAAMRKADPDGPEAAARRQRDLDQAAVAERLTAARDALHAARERWVQRRSDEILRGPGPHTQTRAAEDKRLVARQQANGELAELRKQANREHELSGEAAVRWALEHLGVDVSGQAQDDVVSADA